MLGRTAGHQQQADVARGQAGVFETILRRADSQRRDRFIRRGKAALSDSRGPQDPFRIRTRDGGQLLVVHHARGQISAERQQVGHNQERVSM